MTVTEEILFERRGGVGLVTLNRPKSLNALTLNMFRAFDRQLVAWQEDSDIHMVVVRGAGGRAFCAGGDVVHAWESGMGGKTGTGDCGALVPLLFGTEYALDRRSHRFPKPYVSLLDGYTMGGGAGISVHGWRRIVTGKTLFAMPETAIGIFPDVGGSWFLPRLPGRIGIWLGLTGAKLGPADTLYTGIGHTYVPSGRLEALIDALAGADWAGGPEPRVVIDRIIADHAEAVPEQPTLPTVRAAIDRCFGFDTVEAIITALKAEHTPWAAEQLEVLGRMSPTSLKITLRQLQRGAQLSFDECLKMEFRMSQAVLAGVDFFEGVRAVLIDKDKAPRWSPKTLAEVDEDLVERHFAHLGSCELVFDTP
ncbi:Enoyl-CoA hydratase [uncultured Gammaproteobacteria bacterium]